GVPPAGSGSDKSGEGGGPREPAEPFGMLDDAPLPPKYDVDECVAIPVDPRTMFVYWEVRDDTLAYLQRTHDGGDIALRVLIIEPTWEGPRTHVRDHAVYAQVGDFFLRDLPLGCVVRTGLGWREGEAFVSVAHSPTLEVPPGAPSPIYAESLVRWSPEGTTHIEPGQEGAEAVARAIERAHHHAHRARLMGDIPRGAHPDFFYGDDEYGAGPGGGAEGQRVRPLGASENAAGFGVGGRARTSSDSMIR
ncbi:MAG TPA: DUF4912 domain-containing protein, partial [Polyangiaceae bacterium]|nr:DUF4912 domain-containing protein [Polyangiaceae bacterium]